MEKEKEARSRRWVSTFNNWKDEDYGKYFGLKYKYIVVGKEVGEKGTPHLQAYIEFPNAVRWGTLCKKIPGGWFQPSYGPAKKAAEYCKKSGVFEEDGCITNQGERTDIQETVDCLKLGSTSLENILLNETNKYHLYGRTLEKVDTILKNRNHRNEAPVAKWLWGKTGVGKSHQVFQNVDLEDCFVWKNDHGWWDLYDQQQYVIFNDYRGEINYNELLQLLDKWPYYVCRRNKPPILFNSKYIYFTSSLPPERIYVNRLAEDGIEQLLRRLTVTEVTMGNIDHGHSLDKKDFD